MSKKIFLIFLFSLLTALRAEVNESSGGMYLNYELFNITGNTISLPINLTYSAGIGINQRATWVGLGFDLSLPYIERVPQGSVDEKDGDFDCNGAPGGEYWFYSHKVYDRLITETTNGYKTTSIPGNFTNQQDYYYLSAPFASGRVILGEPANNSVPMVAYLQNWRPIKIVYKINSSSDINKWEITDENGIKYIFGGSSGIVRAEANIISPTHNTSKTLSGVNGVLNKTIVNVPSCSPPGTPACQTTVLVTVSDHYVNNFFNRRWYLTEIQSPNYNSSTGEGERIRISYTINDGTDKVRKRDVFHYADENSKAATSLFRYAQASNEYSTFSFGQDNYYIYPVYPVDIVGPNSKVVFNRSSTATADVLVQGNKRIESIESYTITGTENLVAKVKFKYSTTGLCRYHPFSTGGQGRLQLLGLEQYSADESKVIPLIHFEYTSNPLIPPDNYYRHDFFGYYRNTDLTRSGDQFVYPAGQSTVGDAANPGAEAWSVNRVIYGNGQIKEYVYVPNAATFSSTNESFATAGSELKAGIRVAVEKVYDGLSNTPIVTNYDYANGYIGYRSAIGTSLTSLYSTLNSGEYRQIRNVMVLDGTAVQYGYCKKTTSGTGSVETYYLTPANDLPKYNVAPPVNLYLKDEKVLTSSGLNNIAHCRGYAYKTEYRNNEATSKLIAVMEKQYAVKYNLYSYKYRETEMLPLWECSLGAGGGGSATPIETADNQEQEDFIGYLRLVKTTQKNKNVESSSEVLKYNDVNGLPEIVRSINSDGKQKLSKTFFAFENSNYSTGMGPAGSNMLTQVCQSEMYEKPSGSATFEPATGEIRSAQATTYANTLGSTTWLPKKNYIWKTNLTDGTPDATFADYDHSPSATNPNWQLTGKIDQYTPNGFPIQTTNAASVSSIVLLSNDNSLPLMSVTNAVQGTCLFTNWTENQPSEVNIATMAMSNAPTDLHFAGRTMKLTTNTSNPTGDQYAVAVTSPINTNLPDLSGQSFIVQFWAKGDRAFKTFLHLQALPGFVWSDFQIIDVTTEWKKYEIQMKFPSGVTDKQLRLVLRPPHVSSPEPMYVAGTVLYDDIRVIPDGALSTVTYYDPLWRTIRLTVDANNNPGQLISFDKFGRPVQWDKLDPTKSVSETGYATPMQTKSYHLRNELPAGKLIQVLSPDGGERFVDVSKLTIRWVNSESRSINLYYRKKTSGSWGSYTPITPVGSPLTAQSGWCSYEWTIPIAAGTAADFQVKAEIDVGGEFDESDRSFYVSTPAP